jgi:hypothetical protein
VVALTLFASQLTFHLYARSALTAAAIDSARLVADAPGPGVQATAEANARRALGAYGPTSTFVWTVTATEVVLTLTLPKVGISRTVRLRRERQ